jgi:hypothetical protein
MPTYQNNTDKRITFADKAYIFWQPGEIKALRYFVPHELLGLDQIDPEPFVVRNPSRGYDYNEMIIVPGAPVEDRLWKLPYSEAVEVSVYMLEGSCLMYVGDSEVPVRVDADNNHVAHYGWDMSSYITFESEEEVAVYMKCEPFSFKNMRGESI